MNAVNGYILYRMIRDNNERPRRHSIMPTLSETTNLRSGRLKSEPFCQPIAPHVPIRERLASRARCSSVGGDNDQDTCDFATNPYLNGRRHRRMTLLQSLRYQNKQLADSGFELVAEEKSNKDTESLAESPTKRRSELVLSPPTPMRDTATRANSLSITKIKAKAHALFGKKGRKKRQSITSGEASSKECASDTEHVGYTSIDYGSKESRQRKSPSTNDSGRGSQGRLGIDEEQLSDSHETHKVGKTIAVIENLETEKGSSNSFGTNSLFRSVSCPDVGLNLLNCDPLNERASSAHNNKHLETDSDEEDFTSSSDNFQQNSQKSAEAVGIAQDSDVRFAKRVLRAANSPAESVRSRKSQTKGYNQNAENMQRNATSAWERCTMESFLSSLPPLPPPMPSFPSPVVVHSGSSARSEASADDATSIETSSLLEKMTLGGNDEDSGSCRCDDDTDNDANSSSIVLDQYLPVLSELSSKKYEPSAPSPLVSRSINCSDGDKTSSETSEKVGGVAQTELSLVRISDQLNAYLNGLGLASAIEQKTLNPESMNFLAKHFFEYQSFTNLPEKAVQMHKTPVSQAGADPTAGWGPKSMTRAGKNFPTANARANRNNVDVEATAHRHGVPGKHKYREWGDRHGELKPEKTTSHKDALTKFLSNEEPTRRSVFESDFEDRILQTEPETLPERLARTEEVDGSLPYVPSQSENSSNPEVLTILTYAPQVQFITATVKKAKRLPFNNKPFARIMLFEGRRLLEQKQTTVTPITSCNGCVKTRSRSKPSGLGSPPSPSFASTSKASDAVFSESFLFRMTPKMLDRCHIVIQMYDTNPSDTSNNPFPVGHCVVGPLSPGTGCAHWLQMIRKSGLPICMWHPMINS